MAIASRSKALFTEDTVLFDIVDDVLENGATQQLYHNVDTKGAGDNFNARIDVLAVEETVADVRVIEEGWGDRAVYSKKKPEAILTIINYKS